MEDNRHLNSNNTILDKFNQENNKRITTNIALNNISIRVIESDDSVLVYGNLLGVTPNDLRVDYNNGDVIMNITQRINQQMQGAGVAAFISSTSTFTRSVHVGDVDITEFKYNFSNQGELTIYFPKLKIIEADYIEIE